jgi:hypothetical protein
MLRVVAELLRVPRPLVTSMQTVETLDSRVVLRARRAQYGGRKAMLTVKGSLVTGLVHSVVEVKASSPTRWIITLYQKQRVAA